MRILLDQLFFEWDEGNKDKNYLKHNVTIQEAEEIFGNEPLLLVTDHKHSQNEQRYVALGTTNNVRRLFLSFTIRKTIIRVISVRDMSKKEVNVYEEAEKSKNVFEILPGLHMNVVPYDYLKDMKIRAHRDKDLWDIAQLEKLRNNK